MTAERHGVAVSGPDAEKFLQGQISQDVSALAVGDVAWSLVLQPTGRLVAVFRIQRQSPDSFLLDVEAGFREALIERLERFKLRTDAVVTPVDHPIDVPISWPGVDDPTDEGQRIRGAMPRLGAELTEDTIPGEAGAVFIEQTVSFTKGCYTGQELVARIDSRGGNVPRPIRVLETDAPVAVGAEVRVDGEVVGKVTSAADRAALAPLLRRVIIGQRVQIDGVAAVVVGEQPPVLDQ
jgi:folate-binding protein YgfZ